MPQRFWRERGVAIVAFEGTYQPDEALSAIEDALAAGQPDPAGLLLDLSESESFRGRSTEGLRRVAAFLAQRRDRFAHRLATVGASDLAYGLLRMGMVFTSDQGIESEVFRSRAEAMEWLAPKRA